MRARNPESKTGILRAAIMKLIEQHRADGTIPTSGRFLFYELEMQGDVSKDNGKVKGDDKLVSEALTDLRKMGEIEWDEIKDESRELTQWNSAPTIKDYMRSSVRWAKIDPWDGNPPMVICESRTVSGALYETAGEYLAPITATVGQCGGFLHSDIGPALKDGQQILYYGDLDVQGNDIEMNTKKVLEEIIGGELEWERLALTMAQANRFGLKRFMKLDNRTGIKSGAIEAESLSQLRLVNILRDRLNALLPEPLSVIHAREETQREAVLRLLGRK